MFPRSLVFKNLLSNILYLLHASAGQWHATCTISSSSFPHRRQSCRCVHPSWKHTGCKGWWPVNSPTATLALILLMWKIWWAPNNASKWQMRFYSAFKGLIFSLFIAWSSSVLLDRGSLNRVLDWRATTLTFYPPVQVLLSHTTPDDLFTHKNGEAKGLVRRYCTIPFLDQFISKTLLNLCKIFCGFTELW